MHSSGLHPEDVQKGNRHFATTHWSLVLAAGESDREASRQALEELCRAYWYPLYAYVRRRVSDVHQAQDLTQAFFQSLLEKRSLETADPDRGRFRAFLLTACKRFLVNEWHKQQTQKRGGGTATISLDFELGESKYSVEAVNTMTPERTFEQQWALTLLERVLKTLREEFESTDKPAHFDELKQFLSGAQKNRSYAAVAEALGISEGAAKVAAHRLRTRYRELLRAEIARTVQNPAEVEDEIKSLFDILARPES